LSDFASQPPLREYALHITPDRQLGIAEFGDHEGFPVIWFAGTPGGRRQVPFNTPQYAADHHLRIICIERPGIGLSTMHLYDNILAFSDDIARVTDQLGISQCGIVALSGGGPYALACAHELDEQIVAASIFGGVAPTVGDEAPGGGPTEMAIPVNKALTYLKKPLGGAITGAVKMLHPFADPIIDGLVKYVPGHETDMIGRPDIREMFVDDMINSSKDGLHSLILDTILFTRHWGFSLGNIAVPVHFWQGDEDPLVPLHHGEAMAEIVPGAGLTICENAGHLEGLNKTVEAINFILQHVQESGKSPGKKNKKSSG
jgi:pimeloyl-ACP methyl ester carboxylesterase